jgi:hypothetical protein
VALATVFFTDFALLTVAAQRETARYFQPLMPLIALAVYRAVTRVDSVVIRRVLASLVMALAAHHVVSLSLGANRPWSPSTAPYFHGFPLWDHQTYFSHLVHDYRLGTPADDFQIPETIDLLAGLHLSSRAVIATISTPHAFFQPNGLQFEAVRRGFDWTFVWSEPLEPERPALAWASVPATANVILFRAGGSTGIEVTPPGNLPDIDGSVARQFQNVGRLELGDESVVAVLVKNRVQRADGAMPRVNKWAQRRSPLADEARVRSRSFGRYTFPFSTQLAQEVLRPAQLVVENLTAPVVCAR